MIRGVKTLSKNSWITPADNTIRQVLIRGVKTLSKNGWITAADNTVRQVLIRGVKTLEKRLDYNIYQLIIQ